MVDYFGQTSSQNLTSLESLNDHNCIISHESGTICKTNERTSSDLFPNNEEFHLNDMSSTTSVLPLRPSMKLKYISDTNDQSNFLADSFQLSLFGSSRSGMTRCVSNANSLSSYGDKSNRTRFGTYLINDPNTNGNIASSSMSDVFLSPLTRSQFPSTVFPSTTRLKNVRMPLSQSQSTISDSFEHLPSFDRYRSYYSSFTPPSSTEETTTMSRSSSRQTFTVIDDPTTNASSFSRSSTLNDEEQLMPDENTPYGGLSSMFHITSCSNGTPTYRGTLPTRIQTMPSAFSQKAFLGGIQSDIITEADLLSILRRFGKCQLKWPKNDTSGSLIPGFCHVIYRDTRSVLELLKHCTHRQRSSVDYFLEIHTTTASTSSLFFGNNKRSTKLKMIQVVPWNIHDNICVVQQLDISSSGTKDWSRTIFISTLHGKISAYGLAVIMSQVFGRVSLAQLNTDKYGYPTGTATVLFSDSLGYMRAVAAGSIDIKCECFHKLLEIDPFLRENELCYYCPNIADNFCRNFRCLRSYCNSCWIKKHGTKPMASSSDHPPISRRQQSFPLATLN